MSFRRSFWSVVIGVMCLIWPVTATNALTFKNIQTDLRFQKNDTWTLNDFQADFDGMQLFLSGEIAHDIIA